MKAIEGRKVLSRSLFIHQSSHFPPGEINAMKVIFVLFHSWSCTKKYMWIGLSQVAATRFFHISENLPWDKAKKVAAGRIYLSFWWRPSDEWAVEAHHFLPWRWLVNIFYEKIVKTLGALKVYCFLNNVLWCIHMFGWNAGNGSLLNVQKKQAVSMQMSYENIDSSWI